jgi:hypothetical protein
MIVFFGNCSILTGNQTITHHHNSKASKLKSNVRISKCKSNHVKTRPPVYYSKVMLKVTREA